jgi:dihydroorotate dehydrogenase electron transfer subunit
MKQFQARVRSNSAIARDYYEMSFSWPAYAEQPSPGQFISIKTLGTGDLVLRRPFAISSFDPIGAAAAIIYQKRGKATRMLAAKSTQESIDVIGPLGNSFPVAERLSPVLVAGGVGLGPMIFLGNRLASKGIAATVLLGFRDSSFVPTLVEEKGLLPFTPIVCTDDGSRGFHGTTLDWLNGPAAERLGGLTEVELYACGPNPMMAQCTRFCTERHIPCWVSMEQVMGCGVGACVGCAVPVFGDSPFARVCTEGPVFEANQIKWEELE